MGQCAKCGESNHVTARCKHRQEVQCWHCGQYGHKEKHHTSDWETGQNELAIVLGTPGTPTVFSEGYGNDNNNIANNNCNTYNDDNNIVVSPARAKRKSSGLRWDLPVLINLNARSLCSEKIEELQVTVGIHNVSLVCVSETWFKGYMGNESLSLHGFSLKRKHRVLGRAGGDACYVRHDVLYTRLNYIEDEELEVIWIKVMPKRLPRRFSCILLAVVYYTQHSDYLKISDHIITGIDCIIRKHPECGIVITGDFNQLNDNFLKTHYRFVQVVRTATRSGAVLDKIWTNMKDVYVSPITISELGKSDHNMVLWKPNRNCPSDRGTVTRVYTRCMG